jgi:adenine-specific DNA-methyltransferase
MDKMKMQTSNLSDSNFTTLSAMFPNAVTETVDEHGTVVRAIDADILAQEINTSVVSGKEERYQFTWPDKKKSMLLANAPIAAALRPCREESVDFDNTENLYIEGDNLDVLKLLRETYLNRVKMIYIDPPYNTGRDFIYEDDFAEETGVFLRRDGQFDEQGNRLTPNLESNGRFHTDWLNMIYPRLRVARDMLTDDGIILISIDDCESGNLRKICDEIFGRENFIDTIIWKKRYGGGAKEKYLVSLHEYVIAFCKDISKLGELFIPLSQDSIDRYYSKKDEKYSTRGGYRTHPLEAGKAMDARPNLIYPITAPEGTQIMPKRQWLWGKERAYEALKNNELEILRGNDGSWVVSTKQYLREEDGTMRQGKMLSIIDDVYTQHGTNEMINILGNAKIFNYPKPSALVKKLVSVISNSKEDIVLDFFSGSATTAHAVIQLNAEDGGHRKFIMVQLPEVCPEEGEAAKAGYKTICEIGKERIRRVGAKIRADSPLTTQNLDTGFRVLKLDSSNMKDVYYTPEEYAQMNFNIEGFMDNIKSDRSDEDLLFQVMLELGIPLSAKIRQDGKTFYVNDNYLIACFGMVDTALITEIAKKKPYYAVFRDSSFLSDSAMVNFEQVFSTYSPGTIRRVL